MQKCIIEFIVIFASVTMASPVKSALGGNHIGKLASPIQYNEDGMIEWWDAEWNAGRGIHEASSKYCLPLVEGGATMEIGNSSVLNAKSVDCTSGGGLIVADCPNLISSTDNRRVAFPRTIVWCMRFKAYKSGGTVMRLGLNGADTRIYSMDNYNVKWVFLSGQYDASGMSPADEVLATMAAVIVSGDIRFYVNGNEQRVSTNNFMWCIGGGLAFLCNAAFDSNVVDGEFYNAMMYNRALTTDELNEIAAINHIRYGK